MAFSILPNVGGSRSACPWFQKEGDPPAMQETRVADRTDGGAVIQLKPSPGGLREFFGISLDPGEIH
jgi:hypothetical protein